MSATLTFQAKIHSYTEYLPCLRAARMALFQFQYITDTYVHFSHPVSFCLLYCLLLFLSIPAWSAHITNHTRFLPSDLIKMQERIWSVELSFSARRAIIVYIRKSKGLRNPPRINASHALGTNPGGSGSLVRC